MMEMTSDTPTNSGESTLHQTLHVPVASNKQNIQLSDGQNDVH